MMKGKLRMTFWQRLRGHTTTVLRHKHAVFVHCCRAGIPLQGLLHDLSKFSPTEFIPGVKYYQGYRSPNEKEREEIGLSYAWIHHKGRNAHHYEHWTDYNLQTHSLEPVKMPLKYVKEMFCDRVAASKIYKGNEYTDSMPAEYFNKRTVHDDMAPQTAELLGRLLDMLAEKGEDETFAYIRKLKKY